MSTARVKTPDLMLCGGRDMTSAEAGSTPRPKAGGPPVSMLIHRTARGESGYTLSAAGRTGQDADIKYNRLLLTAILEREAEDE